MKKIIACLFILTCFCKCGRKNEAVEFVALNENAFNAKAFAFPFSKISDSARQSHDSCMGFSFDANVILINAKDTFFIGSIVNRQTLTQINTIKDLGLTLKQLTSQFNIIAENCFEKRVLHIPLKSALGENFNMQLPGATEAMNKEINDAIAASNETKLQSGPWVYLDFKDALKNIMDTAQSATLLNYKKNLLDTSNMVLTSLESITYLSFIIPTPKNISAELQALLKTKPFVTLPKTYFTAQFFYLADNKFQLSLNGFFPMAGRFMQAKLK